MVNAASKMDRPRVPGGRGMTGVSCRRCFLFAGGGASGLCDDCFDEVNAE